MKTPAAVIAAEAARVAKGAELSEARETVKRLEAEYAQACRAVTVAREAADSALSQCRLIRIAWRSGKQEDAGRLVIERKTPAGKLAVRRVGAEPAKPWMFEWNKHAGAYREKVARGSRGFGYGDAALELRDVPPEFMPGQEGAAQAQEVKP